MNKLKIDKNIEGSCLNNVPQDWRVERIKDLGPLQNGVSKGKEYFGSGNPFVSYGNVYNDSIELNRIKKLANSNKGEQKLYSVVEGDIFFTRTSETIDEIGISATAMETIPKATFSGFVIRLRPKKFKIEKEFSKYYFQSILNRQLLSKEINLVTRASLSQGILNNTPVLLPPKEVQQKIAQYLNIRTQAIDKKIKLLQEKIDIYKEYRMSLINETITKGLNKDIELKSSGVKWLGDIPEHWEIDRLKNVSVISTGSRNSEDYDIDGKYPFFVRSKEVKKINSFSFNEEAVLTAGDGDIGKIFHYINGKFDVHQRVYCIRKFKKPLRAKYLYYYLSAKLYDQARINNSNSIVNSLRLPLFRDFKVLLPEKEEQIEISKFLDRKTETIEKIVGNIKQQIKTFKELRKTLINDVVTGKIKETD